MGHREAHEGFGLLGGQGVRIEQGPRDYVPLDEKVGLLAMILLNGGGEVFEEFRRMGETNPSV